MNARREDDSLLSAIAADPLASLRVNAGAIADLAFGSLSVAVTQVEGRHLAMLPTEALELDLSDPLQRQFGDYELIELIGEGGMGVVYRAHQKSLDRQVAVKLLAAGPWASKAFIERFRREAQNAARMHHPNIVTIYEVGSAEELHFFSMRLVIGSSLAGQLRDQSKFAPLRAAQLLRTIAEAVDYAHRLGVLHLDLKPANVLIDENGTPYVADFGLARRLEHGLAADSDEVSGTPSYMAPEQAQGLSQKITPATDIWGLGAILYELVTGKPPFLGESPQATLRLVVEGALRNPREHVPDLPRDLEAIIARCMAPAVAQRYPSARALADDLAAFVEGRAVAARPLNAPQRIERWARREPRLALTALFAFVVLLIGIAATTQQWRRAESSAATASGRLWESRRDAALPLQRQGRGFEALPGLIANIEEQERGGGDRHVDVERREVGRILNDGVVLLNRMHLPNAINASPFAAELSPDGSLFALAMTDLTVHWYDTASLRELGHVDLLGLPDSTDSPETPVLLRFIDSHRLRVTLDWIDFFTAPGENNSYLIDLDAGAVIEFPEDFAALSNASFSADGKYAVLYNRKQQMQVWHVDPWRPISPLATQDFDKEIVLLSRDAGRLIGIGNAQQTLMFFNPRTLAQTARVALPVTSEGLSAWTESNDGKRLAFGDFQGRVFVFDSATGTMRQLPTPVGREVTWVAFSEDDAWLAAVRWDGAAYAFDVTTGNTLNAGQMQHDFELRHVTISHRERLLIASGLGKSGLWRLPEPGPTALPASQLTTSPMRPATAGPYSLGFCASSGLLITAETDGEIRLWRVPKSPVLDAATARFIPGMLEFDGRHIVDVAYNKVRVVDLPAGKSTQWLELTQPLGFAELIDAGRMLITTSGTQLTVFDAATMQPLFQPVDLGNSPMRLVANAASGTVVLSFPERASSGIAERLESYDLRNGRRQSDPVTLKGPLRQFEMSPDGARLLASEPAQTQVFLAPTLRLVGTYVHDAAKSWSWAGFAPNDDTLDLITRSGDQRLLNGRLIAWDPASGKILDGRDVNGAWPVGLVMAAGKTFVAGREFDVLDPGTSSERRLAPPTRDKPSAGLAVSHDKHLVAHAFEESVQVYDVDSGAAVGPPLQTNLTSLGIIGQLAFSPDDRQLLARTMHGRWIVWRVGADMRTVASLRTDAELLNATPDESVLRDAVPNTPMRDPGAWGATEPRPEPAAARYVDGKPIPARAPGTSPLQLDMTVAYNTAPESVSATTHAIVPWMTLVPLGTVRIDGTDYDVRGTVEVHPMPALGIVATNSTIGIPVPDTPIAAFHVLMLAGVFVATPNGEMQVRLRVHYRNGSTADIPLRSGYELPSGPDQDEAVPFGWVWGDFLRLTGEDRQHLLSNPRVPNPHPERLVGTIDLEANSSLSSSPSFFAVTAEPVIAAASSGIDSPTRTAPADAGTEPRKKP